MTDDTQNKEETKKEVAVEEYVDPWQPEQRALLNTLSQVDYASVCDKVSTYPTLNIPVANTSEFMQKLHSEHKFDMLKSHTCVDWLEEGQFELISLLFSTTHLQHIWVSIRIPRDNPVIDTLSHIWPIAEFQEREVYDLFGVKYAGHTDLRRIFLEDDWVGFPLRKDYQDDFMLEKP
jgi:NADH-quinone oxidoreductase subunit C